MNYVDRGYERAWDVPPAKAVYGLDDIEDLLSVTRAAAVAWIHDRRLPPADGPDVNGRPTWTRETVLIWCYARNALPIALLAEAHGVLQGPRARAILEAVHLTLI